MSVQSLLVRISSLVIDHSLKQVSGRKRSKSSRQQAARNKFSHLVEEMEQRMLLAGADTSSDVTVYNGFQLAIDYLPAPTSDDFSEFAQAAPEAAPAAAAAAGHDPTNPLSNGYVFNPADIMQLHSNPGATKIIYLDFDGHITNDPSGIDQTGWNGGQRIDSRPYDIDGDIFTFNDQELSNIYDVWRQVSEDFRPFNIDVTTEEPADLNDLRRQSVAGTIISLTSPGIDEENGSQIDTIETGLTSGSTARAIGMNIGDGAFGATTGDYDWFAVRGVLAGSVISVDIDAESIGSALDSYVTIYDSFGNIVADNDDVDGFDSVLDYEATSDGDYFVVVSGATGGGKGGGFIEPEALLVNGAQDDHLDPGTGTGVHSTGNYNIDISLDIVDTWGIRVVIAGDSGEWLPPQIGQVGGIAFIGSFNSGRDTPTFVFQGGVGSVNGIAEASTHEVGHTVGLDHDGLIQFNTTTGKQVPNWNQTYYGGHGTGVNSWGPIMGASFSRNVTQWSQGEYSVGPLSRDRSPDDGNRHFQFEANNSFTPFGHGPAQDDLSIITGGNGFGYLVDDHGNTLATATPLTEVAPSSFYNTGIIAQRTDLDWFSFTVPQLSSFEVTGVDIRVTPAEFKANLDVAVDLFNSSGQLITFSSPEGRLDGSITFVLDPGETYYIRVDGTSFKNNQLGYSDYGSLGYFEVELNYFEPVIFDDQTFNVAENSAVGTSVGTLVSGLDPIESIIYEIIGGNGNDTFAVDSFTGELTVNDSALLDFETNPIFNLIVRVTDQSRSVVYSETATITINVLDGPEAPNMANQTFVVDENSPNGTSVGTVIAVDPDPARVLSYSIIGGSGTTVFQIDAVTAELTVINSAALNFEVNPTFDLLVQATNDAFIPLGSTATITVNIGDLNELPVFDDVNLPALAEHALNGTSVGTVTGTDPDNGQTLTYSIIAGNPGGDGFVIDPVTGEITVNNTLAFNFHSNPLINLTVQATDDGIPLLSDTALVAFNLIEGQGEPVIDDQVFSLPEFSAVGFSVGFVSAFDPDPIDTISYGPFLSGNTGTTFAIDSVTGEITVADDALLAIATNPTFVLELEISDDGTPILNDTAFITVNLTPFNNPPSIDPTYTFTIEERQPIGTVVGTVIGTDVDLDNLSYSITAGNEEGGFAIDLNGVITVANPGIVDFSRHKIFNLTVQVEDDGFPIKNATAAVTVNVTEFNGQINMSDQEQLLLELINRARLDPLAEAARLGLTGVQKDNFISLGTNPVQALAANQWLNLASVGHSVDMFARNFFGHVNPDGDSFDVRAFEAGFDFNSLAENLDLVSGIGMGQPAIEQLYRQMILNPIKRLNLLDGTYREYGAGIRDNVGLNSTVVTNLVAKENATGSFITGIVFRDAADGSVADDDFYSLGEAIRSGTVRATDQLTGDVFERAIGVSGAFTLRVPAGTYDLEVFGGELGSKTYIKKNVVVGDVLDPTNAQNVKVDFEISTATEKPVTSEIVGFVNGNWWVSSQSSGNWQSTRWAKWSVTSLLESVSGDFNGDGVDDIAGWTQNGSWWIGIAQPNGTFAATKWTQWRTNDIKEIHVGDFNGDGKDDIVGLFKSGANKGNWWVAESTGSGFVTRKWGTYGNYSGISTVVIGDFDGTGRDDIAVMATSGRWWVYLSQTNTFSVRGWTQWNLSQGVNDILVGDFDGNGADDIAGLFGTGNSRNWWVGLSTGTQFSNNLWGTWAVPSTLEHVVAGDFNGDGATDIAGLIDGSTLRVGIAGQNQFTSSAWGQLTIPAGGLSDVSVGDSNGDGLADIFGRASDGWWYTADSNGSSFALNQIVKWNPFANWQYVHVANFDGRTPPVPAAPFAPAFAAFSSSSDQKNEEQIRQQSIALRAVAVSGASSTSGDSSASSSDNTKQGSQQTQTGSSDATSGFESFGDSSLLDLLYQV